MIRRREFITLLGGAAAWPLAARAQRLEMPVIGLLQLGAPSSWDFTGFHQGLKDTGYVEGQTLARIEVRWANDSERLPESAADLVHRRVRVIATLGSPLRPVQPKLRPIQFRSSSVLGPIRFSKVWSPALIGRAATSLSQSDLGSRVARQRRTVRQVVEAGGLLSYGPDLVDQDRQVGRYVGRILKGEKPADLPVQQQSKFELTINLLTAKAIGLTIPNSLQSLADKVIE
jgi:hypothetical protein